MLEARSASTRYLIQLADIITGAIGYHWDEFNLKSDAKPGKIYLADYIASYIKRPNLKFCSVKGDKLLNVFCFFPQK